MTTQAFTDGVTLSGAAWATDVDTATYSYLTALAGLNTLTATGPTSMTAYAAGQVFRFLPVSTNTVTTTLNITANSVALGAKNIFANGAALVGGEIKAAVPVSVIYDGTQFNLIGPILPASQAQQEAGTALGLYVAPARQQFHQSSAKAWARWSTATGTPTLESNGSYNVSSLTDNGAGDATVNLTTSFSSSTACTVLCSAGETGDRRLADLTDRAALTASSFRITTYPRANGTPTDTNTNTAVAFGDQ